MNRRANALENAEPPHAELAPRPNPVDPTAPGRVERLGRLRLPIAGPYRPWATAYRLPDGRVVWCVRLWSVDRPLLHCLPTSTLRSFCRLNGLAALAVEVERVGSG
ncbi:MAG: hypothetical protein L3J95_04225 [Thermoplasmata archaeon]|nr:hypothetical protein [Thermoplasmata archaeon]MCI4359613.1 hypothetical protein [Thermoplasmata archaeon]